MAEIPIQRKESRNFWPLLLGLLALLAVLWFIFGRNRTSDTAASRADSAAVASSGVTTDSAAGTTANSMNSMGGAARDSAAPDAALGDADIVSVIRAVNDGEITAGRLASTKATSSDVKSYAREMITAHQALDAKGRKVAVAVGSTKTPMGDSVSSANAALSSQLQGVGSGAAFDRAYLDGQVQAHRNTLSFLQRAESSAQNAELKQIVTAAIPAVEKHLERAQSLQSKIGQ